MSIDVFIGIDPGKSGGIVAIDNRVVWTHKMPATERDVWDILGYAHSWNSNHSFAYIEKVGAMPNQGVVSMFTFGQNYGMLRAFLIASDIPFETVSPRKWQKEFGLVYPKSMELSPTDKKNRHKARAQELFPDIKVTHAIADALLICEYGRRLRCGEK